MAEAVQRFQVLKDFDWQRDMHGSRAIVVTVRHSHGTGLGRLLLGTTWWCVCGKLALGGVSVF